jgi:peroxiredoxin
MKIVVLAALLCILLPFAVRADDAAYKAPAFRLPDMTGTMIALEDFTGKILLLNFWATWCASCREEFPELERLYQKYRDKGFIVIAISVDNSSDRVAAFMKKRQIGFPVVIDKQGDVAKKFGFSGIPAGFLIDRNGFIKRQYRGSGRELISRYETDIADLLKR